MLKFALLAGAATLLTPGLATAAEDPPAAAPPAPTPDIIVTAKRLDAARDIIRDSLGATTYTLSNANIQAIPGGDDQPFNDIVLQLPGVSQDQFGQLHVRDDHNGLEYRLNGVILPEGIAVFGQSLSPELIDKFDLLTGALPAQYGLHVAGVIDITTKRDLTNGGSISLYGGSFGTIEPTLELHGSSADAATSYFVSGRYTHNDLGIDNVVGTRDAIHDTTNQANVFGNVEHIIGGDDRVSLNFGYTNQHYQIPNPPGLQPGNGYTVAGVSAFASENLNEQQLQTTGFAQLSWLHTAGGLTLQSSIYGRASSLEYRPDTLGELLYNGEAQAATKHDFTLGVQLEASYLLDDHHTLRAGLIFQNDHATSSTQTSVFPTVTDNDPTSATYGQAIVAANAAPINIGDHSSLIQRTYSAYLQDEWKIIPAVTLNYGARFDENDGVRKERQLSPRVNLVAKSGGSTLHVGYARYFSTAPFELVATQTIGLFNNTTAAPATTADDAPYAERINYFDVGVLQNFGRLSLGLDGFYRLSHNLIDEGQFGAPIILTPFNYAKGKVRGVEFTANYAQGGWNVYGNVSLQKAQGTRIVSSQFNFAPDDLAYIASHYIYLDHDQTLTASGGISYRFRSGTLTGTRMSADFVFGSGLRTDLTLPDGSNLPNGAALPSYATANASLAHHFAGLNLDVRVDVTNLFDHIYEIRDGQGVGVGAPSYGSRRGIFAGVTKHF